MLMVIDGPEKIGKTTLIDEISDQLTSQGEVVVRKAFSSLSSDKLEADLHEAETAPDAYHIWDRSLMSHIAYAKMLPKDPSKSSWMSDFPYLSIAAYMDRIKRQGDYICLYTDNPQELAARHDDTDLKVDAIHEQMYFGALTNVAQTLSASCAHDKVPILARSLITLVKDKKDKVLPPLTWLGPAHANVVVACQTQRELEALREEWYTSRFMVQVTGLKLTHSIHPAWVIDNKENLEEANKEPRYLVILASGGDSFNTWKETGQLVVSSPHSPFSVEWAPAILHQIMDAPNLHNILKNFTGQEVKIG